MKYSSKGHKDRNRHKNRIKRSRQARLVYVKRHKQEHPHHVKVSSWGWLPTVWGPCMHKARGTVVDPAGFSSSSHLSHYMFSLVSLHQTRWQTYCSNQNKSKNSGYVCDPLADCCQVEKSSTTLPPIPLLANTMSSTSSTPPSWSLSGGEILYQFATDPSVDQHSRTCVSVKRKTVCLFCTPARSYSFLMSSWKAL